MSLLTIIMNGPLRFCHITGAASIGMHDRLPAVTWWAVNGPLKVSVRFYLTKFELLDNRTWAH